MGDAMHGPVALSALGGSSSIRVLCRLLFGMVLALVLAAAACTTARADRDDGEARDAIGTSTLTTAPTPSTTDAEEIPDRPRGAPPVASDGAVEISGRITGVAGSFDGDPSITAQKASPSGAAQRPSSHAYTRGICQGTCLALGTGLWTLLAGFMPWNSGHSRFSASRCRFAR